MKLRFFLLPLLVLPLTSCDKQIKQSAYYFDTYVESRLYEGDKSNLEDIDKILSRVDKLTDNYKGRDTNNVFLINHNNQNMEIDSRLYKLLSLTQAPEITSLNYYNIFCGSLAKKWKEAINKKKVLSQDVIDVEQSKIYSTHLEFLEGNVIRRVGEGEIDLGSVAKGYALDKVYDYLKGKNYTKYLIDAGSSSILLGEKNKGKEFKIEISDLEKTYLKLKNCFISTSSISRQSVNIDGKTYTHIIDPISGNAICKNDAVIVISDKGYLGDILSTDFMNESLDSIEKLEKQFKVKTIVIKDKKITYQSTGIEVFSK